MFHGAVGRGELSGRFRGGSPVRHLVDAASAPGSGDGLYVTNHGLIKAYATMAEGTVPALRPSMMRIAKRR